jgi:hypothetical protein
MLSERQRLIEALKHELHRLGAFVVSPPNTERIRFQVLSPACESVLLRLRDLGWEATFLSAGLRFTVAGAEPCNTYELNLPAERIPIQDDRRPVVRSEIAERIKTSAEIEGIRRYLDGYHK